MRIDVVDVSRAQAGATQRRRHRTVATIALGARCRDVIGVARETVAHDLAVDPGAASARMLKLFQDQDASALAHDEAVPVDVPGTRSPLWRLIEMRRQCPRRGKPRQAKPADRRLGATGDHHVGIAQGDHAAGIPDRVRAGGACGHHRVVGALEAEADRHLAAHQIDQAGRDEEGTDPPGASLLELDRRIGDGAESADSRADQHAGTFAVFVVFRQPVGILDGFRGGGEPIDDEQIVSTGVLRCHHLVAAERALAVGRQQSGDLRRQIIDLEPGDPPDPALALDQTAPADLHP